MIVAAVLRRRAVFVAGGGRSWLEPRSALMAPWFGPGRAAWFVTGSSPVRSAHSRAGKGPSELFSARFCFLGVKSHVNRAKVLRENESATRFRSQTAPDGGYELPGQTGHAGRPRILHIQEPQTVRSSTRAECHGRPPSPLMWEKLDNRSSATRWVPGCGRGPPPAANRGRAGRRPYPDRTRHPDPDRTRRRRSAASSRSRRPRRRRRRRRPARP